MMHLCSIVSNVSI